MKQVKIENVTTYTQFATRTADSQDRVRGSVHKVGPNLYLYRWMDGKTVREVEFRGDAKVWVDYDLDNTEGVKRHGKCGQVMAIYPGGKPVCIPCAKAQDAETAKARKENPTRPYKASAEVEAAQEAKRVADAKIDRLMARLAETCTTIPSSYKASA